MTIANLGLAIDSSQAAKASSDLDQLVVSAKGAAAAADSLTAATKPAAQATADLSKAATPAAAAMADLNKASVASVAATTAHAAATTHAANAHAGLSTQAMAASHSIRSTVEMLAMGIPPTQALASQMNHLSYAATGPGGLKGAFSEAIGMFGRMLTPMTVLGGAALGAGVAAIYLANSWSESGAQVQRALIGVGAATGATAADIQNFAKANSSATSLTVGEARDAAIEFTKTGNIAVQGLKGVGDAIHGYSILTGQDATEATKALAGALSGDLVQGAMKINQTYGTMNSSTLDYIRTLDLQGDRSKAIQVIIDSIAPANMKAAESVGILTKAYQGLANVMSKIKNGPTPAATSPQDQVAGLQAQRDSAAQSGTSFGRNANGEMVQFANNAALLADFDQKLADAQKNLDSFNTDHVTKQLDKMSIAGDDVVRSIIPQIEQIENLKKAQATLQAAQNTPGVSRSLGQDDAAGRAMSVRAKLLQDSLDVTDQINTKTLEIASHYQDVSVQTAITLDMQKQQLAVASAVTGEDRMAAQEALTRSQLDLHGQDGAVIAAGQRKIAEAQVTARVQEQLLAMRDQLGIAQAVTGAERMRAEATATTNAMARDSVDATVAQSAADMQRAIAEAQVDSSIQSQISGLSQQTELIRARANGNEASVMAAQAYTNAIKAGASETEAAALSAAVLANNVAKAGGSARSFASSMKGDYANLGQFGDQAVGMPGTGGTPLQQAMWDAQYGPGGYKTYLNGGFGSAGGRFDAFATPNDQGQNFLYTKQLTAAAEKSMDAVTKAKFEAGSFKLPASDAQSLANSFLQQGSNATDVNAQKAAASFVSQYGDSASGSSTSLVSPLYMSSSGATNLGFRAAEGMDYTVPGSGPVDSVKVSGLVSPGERMIMIPPGGAAPRDMQGGGGTKSRPSIQQTINISAPSMQGASDTMSQLAARASRAAYAASRHR